MLVCCYLTDSEDDWDQGCGAIRDRHDASRAHNLPAHGACALPGQPGADAGIAEEVAACQLNGCSHCILHGNSLVFTTSKTSLPCAASSSADQLLTIVNSTTDMTW